MEVSSDEEEGGAWSDEESEAEQEGDAGEDSDEEEASGEEQTGKKRKVGKDSDSDDSDDQKRRVIKGRPQRGDHKIVNNRKVTKRNSFFKDLF
ncbi:hypothetical protein H632_c2798p1 [Helicosporidium sp. ATCC 50920]|nr:hypothetical protein H632_c2798p1 [Helicosporidium sp. ATCC 50920]|eukprot:KDD72867.1 hypothetical protein H632_c2798p1 [Helicosporidium sp. ATCC 50920]